MAISKICVVGAGIMGHGIALVCAQGGFRLSLVDVKDELVRSGLERIRKFLQGSLERKKLTQKELDDTLDRIQTTTDLGQAAGDASLVIEAVVENVEIKKELFRRLDKICGPDTIFATNTSYQSVTEIAAVTKRPDRFIGMHWFNPPPIMRGIEVVRTEKTSDAVVSTIVDLCHKVGKEPALVSDSPGFIANRLLQVWRNECYKLYDGRVAAFQDIDNALKHAYNFRMGPFELSDLVGLETVLTGSETMLRETGSESFRPPRCVIMKVRAGDYGRKTGRGFYEYGK